MAQVLPLRIDDIGASTKQYCQGGRWPWANSGPLKRLPALRRWGPYEELTVAEWETVREVWQRTNTSVIVAITATWVDAHNHLIPFPEKFPDEAAWLKQAAQAGWLTIANHGLTHCVVGQHLPRFWSDNRSQHREFWPHLPATLHHDHIQQSTQILENFFEQPIRIFVPPGNVWTRDTYEALRRTHVTTVYANRRPLDDPNASLPGITFVDDRNHQLVIHDRDLKLYGATWLATRLSALTVSSSTTSANDRSI